MAYAILENIISQEIPFSDLFHYFFKNKKKNLSLQDTAR